MCSKDVYVRESLIPNIRETVTPNVRENVTPNVPEGVIPNVRESVIPSAARNPCAAQVFSAAPEALRPQTPAASIARPRALHASSLVALCEHESNNATWFAFLAFAFNLETCETLKL